MTTEPLTAVEQADRDEDERLRRADRKLLAETLHWARVNGYGRARSYESGQFIGYSWVAPYKRVLFDPSGDGTVYYGNGMLTPETAREAVDVLCALGVLPPSMFSAIRNGYCHDEYGIFEDRREHELGIAYTETRYSRAAALVCAEEQRMKRPYPIEVKRRKVLHTDWEVA